jgi:Fur family ferric uptake transcriptional regulator
MSTGRRSTKMDLVYDALVSEGGFVSAQDLYRKLKDRGENIGLATVYRSLQSLSESGSVVIARGDDSETEQRKKEKGKRKERKS